MKNSTVFIILFVVGFLVFGNSLFNGFVWDDLIQIRENRSIYALQDIPTFFARNDLNLLFYRPIFFTYFAVVINLLGDQPIAFHIVQLFIHCINSSLVFLLFLHYFRRNTSLFLSMIFLVHPLVTESVIYISAAGEPLYTFFGLVAFLLLRKKQAWGRILPAILLLFLSLLSKETAVAFFCLITINMVIQKRLTFLYGAILSVPIFLYIFLRLVVAKIYYDPLSYFPLMQTDILERLLSLPKILSYYITLFIFPNNLAIDQQWIVRTITLYDFYLPLAISLATLFVIIKLALTQISKRGQSRPTVLYFLSWVLLGMLPYLQLFPLEMTVAPRYMYFSLIGVLGMCGIWIDRLHFPRQSWQKTALTATAILVICILAGRTILRNQDWKDPYTLYSRDIIQSPDSYTLQSNLGKILFEQGEYQQAEVHLKKSVELSPTWWGNWNNLGNVYLRTDRLQKAKESYSKAISNNDLFFEAYNNLAYALLLEGKNYEAKAILIRAINRTGEQPKLFLLLAIAEYRLGNRQAALGYVQYADQSLQTPLSEDIYQRIILNQRIELNLYNHVTQYGNLTM